MRTASLSRSDIISDSRQKIAIHLGGKSYSARTGIALASRILFMNGHDSGLAGQITARGKPGNLLDPGPSDSDWTNHP